MPKKRIPNYSWAEKQLLPCPFCGNTEIQILPQKPPLSTAQLREMYPDSPDVRELKYWMVRCIWCPARMMVLTDYQSHLVAEWNRRAKPKEPQLI